MLCISKICSGAEHQIPGGSVSTYKLIAKHIIKENRARAVGDALARNPFPIIVPYHRAIHSDGHSGGFQGGLEMKRTLLETLKKAFHQWSELK